MYKMITLDMDGTLLNEDKVISIECKKAMHEAALHNKYVVIATGRAISELEDYRKDFDDVSYIIGESGAVLYDWQKQCVVAKDCFEASDVEKIYALSKKQDTMIQWFRNGSAYVYEDQLRRLKDYEMGEYQGLFNRTSNPIYDLDAFMEENKHDLEKMNLYHRTVDGKMVTFEASKAIDVDKSFAELTSVEFSPKGVSKAKGLQVLCELLKVDIAQTISVGDSYNDLQIMEAAGLAVAMKNAKPEVLEIADVVVCDNNHDGCAEAIYEYLLK